MNGLQCVFCNIISGQIPSTRVAENDMVIVIKDISPKAPVHYLILPKKHIKDIQSFGQDDAPYASAMLLMAQQISQQLADSKACRLIMNNGADVGQSVFHAHLHFLSGKKMLDF